MQTLLDIAAPLGELAHIRKVSNFLLPLLL